MRGNEVLLVLLGLGALYLVSQAKANPAGGGPAGGTYAGDPGTPMGFRNTAGDVTCIDKFGVPYRIPVGPCPDYQAPPAGIPLDQVPVLVDESKGIWSEITSIF